MSQAPHSSHFEDFRTLPFPAESSNRWSWAPTCRVIRSYPPDATQILSWARTGFACLRVSVTARPMTDMLARQRKRSRPSRDYDPSVALAVITDELIAEAGRRLASAAPGAEVILFGSHARGEANEHSDLDLLVIEPEVANEAEESVRLRRELRGLGTPFDIIVVSRRYAEEWREIRGGLVHAALSEGKVLEA